MDAAALIDCSVPILDISAGLSVDPLSGRELDHYLKGSPSPRYSLSPFGLLLMDRRVYVPEYRPERGNLHIRGLQAKHDHPTEVTSVTTKHWSDYVATTFGPAYGRTARSSPYSASCAPATKPLAIVLTACCSLYRSRGAYGTLSVWTLSSIYPRLTVSPLSWWLLTVCPSNVLSFQLRTQLLPRTLQMHSLPMCSQSMASLSMCPPTADRNSPLTRLPLSNAPTLHIRSPPLSQRSGRAGQHHLGTVPSFLLQLRAGQLVHLPPTS